MATKKVSKKKVAKKAPAKKVAKKAVAKKAPAKKAPAKKAVAEKVPAKKAPAKKVAAKKAPVKKVARIKRVPIETIEAKEVTPRKVYKVKEIAEFKDRLLTLRERVSGEYSALSRDNMAANQRDPSLSDQGSDTFDREMELNMMGSEQEVIFEIDAALRRIEKGTYGICELTEEVIPKERLLALPYVRYTVRAQSELELGRAHFRPFGGTMHG
jgi:DnaK suppressor protein